MIPEHDKHFEDACHILCEWIKNINLRWTCISLQINSCDIIFKEQKSLLIWEALLLYAIDDE